MTNFASKYRVFFINAGQDIFFRTHRPFSYLNIDEDALYLKTTIDVKARPGEVPNLSTVMAVFISGVK